MYTRISKTILVWALALFTSLVVFNNLTDYWANYGYVQRVLSMDSVSSGHVAGWRAIESAFLHHTFFSFIIFVEAVVAVLCWVGGSGLARTISDPAHFHKAKGIAVLGLTLGIILWFTGFMTLAGEWFLMWQLKDGGGQQAAFRLVVIFGITLLYLVQPDGKEDA